ncbi:hypothetical protein HDU96_010263 [Phlyctochytrium bullatum]|nr:hypothetical protein HDU96_010263 [Phlyctochytrium bullatum]
MFHILTPQPTTHWGNYSPRPYSHCPHPYADAYATDAEDDVMDMDIPTSYLQSHLRAHRLRQLHLQQQQERERLQAELLERELLRRQQLAEQARRRQQLAEQARRQHLAEQARRQQLAEEARRRWVAQELLRQAWADNDEMEEADHVPVVVATHPGWTATRRVNVPSPKTVPAKRDQPATPTKPSTPTKKPASPASASPRPTARTIPIQTSSSSPKPSPLTEPQLRAGRLILRFMLEHRSHLRALHRLHALRTTIAPLLAHPLLAPSATADLDISPTGTLVAGSKRNSALVELEERLTQAVVKADGVESLGSETVRRERKRLVGEVMEALGRLEEVKRRAVEAVVGVNSKEEAGEKMEAVQEEVVSEEAAVEEMDVTPAVEPMSAPESTPADPIEPSAVNPEPEALKPFDLSAAIDAAVTDAALAQSATVLPTDQAPAQLTNPTPPSPTTPTLSTPDATSLNSEAILDDTLFDLPSDTLSPFFRDAETFLSASGTGESDEKPTDDESDEKPAVESDAMEVVGEGEDAEERFGTPEAHGEGREDAGRREEEEDVGTQLEEGWEYW